MSFHAMRIRVESRVKQFENDALYISNAYYDFYIFFNLIDIN